MFAMSATWSRSFTGDPTGGGGDLPQASPILGVGPPSRSAFKTGRLAAVEPEPRGPALKWWRPALWRGFTQRLRGMSSRMACALQSGFRQHSPP
jgi:hypothetical protein